MAFLHGSGAAGAPTVLTENWVKEASWPTLKLVEVAMVVHATIKKLGGNWPMETRWEEKQDSHYQIEMEDWEDWSYAVKNYCAL